MTSPLLFAASSHYDLSFEISKLLDIPLAKYEKKIFSNDNIRINIQEELRNKDVFVLQTACPPLHDNIFELLIFLETLRLADTRSITAIIPYFPYVRSDKPDKPKAPVIAKLMAKLLQTAGATNAILIDLHSPQEQAFFDFPTDVLSATPLLINYIHENLPENPVLVAPDAGELKDLLPYADNLNIPLAVIDKRRLDDSENPLHNVIVGNVKNKTAILIDDEVTSGNTLLSAANILINHGAKKIWALCTHPVLSNDASTKIAQSPIEKLVVTNTIPIPKEKMYPFIQTLSIAPLIANCIKSTLDSK